MPWVLRVRLPCVQASQGDRRGIEQIQQCLAFPAQLAAGLPHQQAGRLLKDR
jgi:hypothetical protein